MRFQSFRQPVYIPGDGVYLLSERFPAVRLSGETGSQVAQLCSGPEVATYTDHSGTPVARHLQTLMERGLVVDDAQECTAQTSLIEQLQMFKQFTDAPADLGLNPTTIVHLVGEDLQRRRLLGLLAEVGVTPKDAGSVTDALARPEGLMGGLTLLAGEDYLSEPALLLGSTLRESGVPMLASDLSGSIPWIGPLMVPGRTGCLHCLEPRLRGNNVIRNYIEQMGVPFPKAIRFEWDFSRETAGRLLALQVLHVLSSPQTCPALGAIITVDLITLQMERHLLHQRPQCGVCGDGGLQARMQWEPLTLTRREKISDTDGGYRAAPPEELIERFEPQVSHISGAIKQLVRMPSVDGLHAYQAGQNFALPMRNVGHLRLGLRSAAAGKGMSDAQARASAIGEAIERNSGRYFGDEATITASYRELGEDAIHPNELALYSDRQIQERDRWNAKALNFQAVCDPLDPDERIEWTPLWSMTASRFRYLPTMALFYGYPFQHGNRYASADSNGCAAGGTVEDAILQGFFELVERDSVAIWWYNRLRVPQIDPASFTNPYFKEWEAHYRQATREVWLLDVTTDLGIPSVVSVSRRVDKSKEDILLGFGAHYDIEVAAARAMTEMNQFLPALINVHTDSDPYPYDDPEQQKWWKTATLENQPYLRPLGVRSARDFEAPQQRTLDDDIRHAVELTQAKGLEFLVLQQTRPDLGLPVVKVVVPGMRHFWTRFAPGRLYDVPVAMGHLARPVDESDLNPIGMFL